MKQYLFAEHLKCKRTFIQKITWLSPLCMVGLIFLIGGMYFTYNGYNWWYIMIAPATASLMAIFMQRLEEKIHYKGIFLLPISHSRIWKSKVFLLCIYFTITNMLHFAGITIGSLTVRTTNSLPILSMFVSSVVISIANLWLIPFSMFLAKKVGLLGTLLINLGLGTVLEVLCVDKFYWWLCPYAYSARMMCPILHILPNGLIANSQDPLLHTNAIGIGIGFSILVFVGMLMLTTSWFAHWEEIK